MKVSEIQSKMRKPEVTKGDLVSWLESCSPERDLIKLDSLRMGDTFWYTVVGGKRRPWVTLWVRVDKQTGTRMVGAASLTHTDMEGGWECKDRMWNKGCYIGPTLITVEEQRVKDSVYFPYTNLKHLTEIKQNIKKVWG